MAFFRTRPLTPMRTNTPAGNHTVKLNDFQSNLNMAITLGKMDSGAATEHMFKINTLLAQKKHNEANKYVETVNKSLGVDKEIKFT